MGSTDVIVHVGSMQTADARIGRIRMPAGYCETGESHDQWPQQPFYAGDISGYLKHRIRVALHRVVHSSAAQLGQHVLDVSPQLSAAILGWQTSNVVVPAPALRGPRPPSGKGKRPDPPELKRLKDKYRKYRDSVRRSFRRNGNRDPGGQWPFDTEVQDVLRRVGLMNSNDGIDVEGVRAKSMKVLFKNFKV